MAGDTKRKPKQDTLKSQRTSRLQFDISGVIFVAAGLFTVVSLMGMDVGIAGQWTRDLFLFIFGKGAFIPALVLILIGARYIYLQEELPVATREMIWFVYFVLVLVTYHWWYIPRGAEFQPDYFAPYGGLIGGAGLLCLRTMFGEAGVKIALVAIAVVNTIILTKWTLADGAKFIGTKTKPHIQSVSETVKDKIEHHRQAQKASVAKPRAKFFDIGKKEMSNEMTEADTSIDEGDTDVESDFLQFTKTEVKEPPTPQWKPIPPEDVGEVKPDIEYEDRSICRSDYQLPQLSLLSKGKRSGKNDQREITESAEKLEKLLASFGVEAKVVHASRGPSVTRYELEPGAGVKVNKIVNLADDIALQLAATDVRIEAPIPGKAAVGIEVPNREVGSVSLRDVLECDEFQKSSGGIVVGLGEDITGKPVITDLAKMPHLLVAGSTGSGKSVCINTLIASILFRSYPDEVKLILIDPKVVELANYNHLPHLMTPVVTDPKKAASVLRWAVREMENRYRLFASANVREVSSYNKQHPEKKLPLILIIIDELADLMMVASAEVEDAICRLTQKARAAGIHLVLATQRPSVDVITGLIKANVPSRISFAVSSQIDSRTILDDSGAEKLLGKGDMLFKPTGTNKPKRIQGAFISDAEVDALVSYIRSQGIAQYQEEIEEEVQSSDEEAAVALDDDMLEDAIRLVMDTRQASVSMLQRRFRIGYTRAGRLIDTMEKMGIVGPHMGSKAREILMSPASVEELLEQRSGGETYDGDR